MTALGDRFPSWLLTALNFGQAYPKGDEDRLFELGDAWHRAASTLEQLEPDLKRVAGAVPQYYTGDGATAVSKEFDTLFDAGFDSSIPKLVESLHRLGHDTRATGTEIEYIKIQEEAFAVLTLYTAVSLMVSMYGDVLLPAFLAAAREAMAEMAEAATERIAAIVARSGLDTLAKPLLREVVIPLTEKMATNAPLRYGVRTLGGTLGGAVLGAGLDAGTQVVQILEGHRDDGFDLKRTFQTSISWGAGGLLGTPVHLGAAELLTDRLSSRLGGLISGGVGGMAGGVGMYAGGLGNQIYDHFAGGTRIDWSFDPKLLVGGAVLGGLGGAKHGLDNGGGSSGEGTGRGSPRSDVPDGGSPKPPVITPDSNADGKHLFRAFTKEAHSDVLSSQPEHIQQLGRNLTEEALKMRAEAFQQGGFSEQQVSKLEELRSQWRTVVPPEGTAPHPGKSGTPEFRAGSPDTTARPPEPTVRPSAVDRSTTPTGPGPSTQSPSVPQRTGLQPDSASETSRAGGAPVTGADNRGTNVAATQRGERLPAVVAEEPQPPAARERGTGALQADPIPDIVPAELPKHANPAVPQADPSTHSTPVTVRAAGGNSTAAYDALRRRAGDEFTTTLQVRVHLDDAESLPPEHIQAIRDNLRAAVHEAFDIGATLSHGDHVEVHIKYTAAADDAHLSIPVGHPDGTELHSWSRETDSVALVRQLRGHLGLPNENGEFALTPADLRLISHDVMAANTDSPVRGLHHHDEQFGPSPLLDQLEDPRYQEQILDAARQDDHYTTDFDPRTQPAARLVNDGGPEVPGRRTNCMEAALSGLFTFKGKPTVALAMRAEIHLDGTVAYSTGEPSERAVAVLGGPYVEFPGDIPAQYQRLQDLIAELGPGSAAFVRTRWQMLDPDTDERIFRPDGSARLRGGHASLIVYPRDAPGPVWWDPQSHEFCTEPPAEFLHRSGFLNAIPLLPDGSPHFARTIEHDTGRLGLPGSSPLDRPVLRPLPVRAGMGDRPASDEGGRGAGRLGGAGPDGAGRPNQGDLPVPELVGDQGEGALPGDGAEGSTAAGVPDLSTSDSSAPGPDTPRTGPGRVRDPDRIPDGHNGSDSGVHPVHRSPDHAVSPDGHLVGDGSDLGDRPEPGEPGLAAGGARRLLTGFESEEPGGELLSGLPESPWDPIGPEQHHQPTSHEVRNELRSAADQLAARHTEIATVADALADMARELGTDPEGLRATELQRAMESALNAKDAELEELSRRGNIPSGEMVAYWDELHAQEALGLERLEFRRRMYASFSRLHAESQQVMNIRIAAETIAVQDVLEAMGARPAGPEGVGVLFGDPVQVLVVSRTVVLDDPVSPDSRQRFLSNGVKMRYLQVRVEDSGEVTVVDVRGPTESPQAHTTSPQSISAPPQQRRAAPQPAPGARAPEPVDLTAQREDLVVRRDAMQQLLNERTDALGIEPTLLDPRPGESQENWRTRVDDVVAALHQRPTAGKGVTGFLPRVPVEDIPRFRSAVDELAQTIADLDTATTAVHQADTRIEAASWLETERAALITRGETLRELRDQIAATLGLTPDRLEPAVIDHTLARLRDNIDPLESTVTDRAVEELAEKSTDLQRITDDIATIDADLTSVAAGEVPHAYHDQLVNDRKAVVQEREFWRGKRDNRAARLNLPDPDEALGPAHLPDTLAELREQVTSFHTTVTIGDDPAASISEHLAPQELARRNRAIDNLEDAAERFNELSSALAELNERLPSNLPRESPYPTSLAEVERLSTDRANLWTTNTELRKQRAELARQLGVDLADLGPDRLARTIDDLYDTKVPPRTRDAFNDRVRRLAEVSRQLHPIDNEIGRIQDRLAEISGAGKEILDAAGARRLTERVGIVDGHDPRVIVIGPRESLEHAAVEHDSALADAIRHDARLANAMRLPSTVVEYHRIVAEYDGRWRTEQGLSPKRLLARYGLESVAIWRDSQGIWHHIEPDRPNIGGGSQYKPKTYSPKEIPDGMSTSTLDTNQALLQDPFMHGHPGEVDRALLTPVPAGGRMDEDVLHTFKDPFAGTAGMVFRLAVEAPKLLGLKFHHPDDPYTFHVRVNPKNTAWYKNYFADHPVIRQPMVRQWEAWEHGDTSTTDFDVEKQQQAVSRWAGVREWADQQYDVFRADDGDLERIRTNLTAKRDAILEAQADKLIDKAAEEADKHIRPDLERIVRTSGVQLRDERPETMEALLDHMAFSDRLEVLDLLSEPAFTQDQLRQIKDHLMRDELLVNDPRTGDPVRRPLDAVADVAEAWHRLIDGTPGPADILLLRDALAESNYLREHPGAFWSVANQHAIALGYDWDSNRTSPAAWRAKIDYTPLPLEPEPGLPSRPSRFEAPQQPHLPRGPEPESQPQPESEAPSQSEATSQPKPEADPGRSLAMPTAPVQESNIEPRLESSPETPVEGIEDPKPSAAEPDSSHIRRPWLWGVGTPRQPPNPPCGPIPPSGPVPSEPPPKPQPGPGSSTPNTSEPPKDSTTPPGAESDSDGGPPAAPNPAPPEARPTHSPDPLDAPDDTESPDIPFTPPDDAPVDPGTPGNPEPSDPSEPPGVWIPLPRLPDWLGTGSSGGSSPNQGVP
ncbi:MAG: hypothetical protein JWN03_3691 [Nocardia sp.]|uniref:WXG100-like domain-containing protein n=1 Tax=Nocardia sp. TaxID=1821 RepID=UPI0026142FC3|nr:toxin glutamine deamidase domain-containing protein [Nocardia sp.]MCU1643416.1 hypothetical protein [Nocardia sp.]